MSRRGLRLHERFHFRRSQVARRSLQQDAQARAAEARVGRRRSVEFRHRSAFHALLPLLVLALVAALGVASLRIDLIRTRYALAAAMDEEKRLIEEQHALIVQKLQGRDPVELAVLAKQRGFRPTAPSLSLADPLPSTKARAFGPETISPPAVAAAPPHFGRGLEAAAR